MPKLCRQTPRWQVQVHLGENGTEPHGRFQCEPKPFQCEPKPKVNFALLLHDPFKMLLRNRMGLWPHV